MSWGERSCKTSPCPMTNFDGIQFNVGAWTKCNVDCPHYQWDGHTKPDSKPARRKKKCGRSVYSLQQRKWRNNETAHVAQTLYKINWRVFIIGRHKRKVIS